MMTAATYFLVFCFLVFVHEFGHFSAAKLCNVLVHEFAIGMGPTVIKKQGKETLYALRLLPIGGYVRMEGEDASSEHPRGFVRTKPWQKVFILAAGAGMNFLTALVLYIVIFSQIGIPGLTIEKVLPGKPADAAGILVGDKILAIDGQTMKHWNQVTKTIGASHQAIEVTVQRTGGQSSQGVQRLDIRVTPVQDEESTRMIIGMQPRMEKDNPLAIIGYSGAQITGMGKAIVTFLAQIPFRGMQKGDVVGPVGMFSMVGDAAKAGSLQLMLLTAVLSVNLGIFNLLPFPALDGSRIIFACIEWIRGRAVNPEREGRIHFVGFAILLTLMAFLVYNDLRNL